MLSRCVFLNAKPGIAVNPDTSNEQTMLPAFVNANSPNDCKDKVGINNPVPLAPVLKNAELPILVIVEGRVPDSLVQARNAVSPTVVNGIPLKFVMVIKFPRASNALVSIVVIPGGNVIEAIAVHPVKADAGIVVKVELASKIRFVTPEASVRVPDIPRTL